MLCVAKASSVWRFPHHWNMWYIAMWAEYWYAPTPPPARSVQEGWRQERRDLDWGLDAEVGMAQHRCNCTLTRIIWVVALRDHEPPQQKLIKGSHPQLYGIPRARHQCSVVRIANRSQWWLAVCRLAVGDYSIAQWNGCYANNCVIGTLKLIRPDWDWLRRVEEDKTRSLEIWGRISSLQSLVV